MAINSSIDALPASLDSVLYKGGNILFVGSQNNKLATFTGASLDATIETGEFEHSNKKLSLISQVRPIYEKTDSATATVTVQVASRKTTASDYTYGSASSVNTDGFAPIRSNNRYHRVKLNLTGEWTNIQAIDIDITNMGSR